jgi:hypothetical protein
MEEPFERLRDEVARQDEHSHVDAVVRERIAKVVLKVENEPLEETAGRIVERLSLEADLVELLEAYIQAVDEH